ncbi:hypothetical protein Q9R32_04495 [Actinotalea sp. AC32]|nr:hypothetical protein [Actinotalea sp. AC32]
MTWSEVAFVALVVVLVLVWSVWVAATRLDRLHRKVGASRSALENQLVRRASVAAEIAATGVLDPVSSVLVADAAWSALAVGGHGASDLIALVPDLAAEARRVGPGPDAPSPGEASHAPAGAAERESAESELSRTLRTALDDPSEVAAILEEPLGAELLEALAAAWYRVELARRFHNEAVAQAQRMRHTALVRLLRLHGHAPMPRTVEIDDGWPDGLPRPGHAA